MIDEEFVEKLQMFHAKGKDGVEEMRALLKNEGGMARLIGLARCYTHGRKLRSYKKNRNEIIPGLEFPSWWPMDAWGGFVEMRKKIRQPLTDYARELIVKEILRLRAQGHDPQSVLEQSIRNAWRDVYPIGGNRGPIPTANANTAPLIADAALWTLRLETFHHGNEAESIRPGYWREEWGPAPSDPACRAPQEAVKAYAARHAPRPLASSGAK